MNIHPGDEIGDEIHNLDQFFRIESGNGKIVLDGKETEVSDGDVIIVPSGTKHNVINVGKENLKLYTIYSPPAHKDGVVRSTKAEADASEEHFDGKTTE
jgi:mannose-6-phosphate isomerase-like protein (cupin superfamily)